MEESVSQSGLSAEFDNPLGHENMRTTSQERSSEKLVGNFTVGHRSGLARGLVIGLVMVVVVLAILVGLVVAIFEGWIF